VHLLLRLTTIFSHSWLTCDHRQALFMVTIVIDGDDCC
jgi:hypothetical protein